MKITDYSSDLGEYVLPEGLREVLVGKSIEEQMRYFGIACVPQFASQVRWDGPCDREFLDCRIRKLDADDYVCGVIVDAGVIVGVEIESPYEGHKVSLLEDRTYGVCVYSASDNNGAGYKEYTEYRFLVVFPKGYVDSI